MNTQKESINAQLAEMKSFLAAKVKAEPENAEAWRELAQVKMMEGDIGGAENDCIECLRLDPKNAAGLVLMGNLLSNAKGDDEPQINPFPGPDPDPGPDPGPASVTVP